MHANTQHACKHTTCMQTHTLRTDRDEGRCCLTEIFGEEKCLEFAFERRESAWCLGGDCSRCGDYGLGNMPKPPPKKHTQQQPTTTTTWNGTAVRVLLFIIWQKDCSRNCIHSPLPPPPPQCLHTPPCQTPYTHISRSFLPIHNTDSNAPSPAQIFTCCSTSVTTKTTKNTLACLQLKTNIIGSGMQRNPSLKTTPKVQQNGP